MSMMQMPSTMLVACPACGQQHATRVANPKPVHGDDPCPLVVAMHEKQIEAIQAQIDAAKAADRLAVSLASVEQMLSDVHDRLSDPNSKPRYASA